MKNDAIQKVLIRDLNLRDVFFDSLRDDYPGFDNWLAKKANNGDEAYVLIVDGRLLGFLYLKEEVETDNSINPYFDERRRLKIGTFKIDSHGTVLGQRFLSIILRKMLNEGHDFTYVTLFKKQTGLISLFEKFGFQFWGDKSNGELVYYKDFTILGDPFKDFPKLNLRNNTQKHLLGIYPEFHTKLFPDSRLNTERNSFIEDLSFTNTSEKIYLCNMSGVQGMQSGDLVTIYRTKDKQRAEYSSLATSICTVLEVKNISEFSTQEEFLRYCGKGTIFSRMELISFWNTKRYPYIIKMLYNVPLQRRIIRKYLIERVGLNRDDYFGYLPLTDNQFNKILELGVVNESFIIN